MVHQTQVAMMGDVTLKEYVLAIMDERQKAIDARFDSNRDAVVTAAATVVREDIRRDLEFYATEKHVGEISIKLNNWVGFTKFVPFITGIIGGLIGALIGHLLK
jgi:hypothetical protein